MYSDFTDIEKNYLKRFAALQFPSSKDNYSTRHPIHFLQEQTDQMEKVSHSDFDEYQDEIATVEYVDCGEYETYSSVEELVCQRLDGFAPDDEEAVEKYNAVAKENGEPEFIPYEEAVIAGDVPGTEEYIGDVDDYLEAYGLEPSNVTFYKNIDAPWDVKAVSFTHKGVLEVKEKISNHIFRPTKTYAFTTTDGDFPVLMGVLMKLGKELLNEETIGLRWMVMKLMTPEQVSQQFEKTPNEEFCLATYNMYLPWQMTEDGRVRKVILSVYASGEMGSWSDTKYPISKLRVELEDGELKKSCGWPFECDGLGESLLDNNKVIALMNYIRYI